MFCSVNENGAILLESKPPLALIPRYVVLVQLHSLFLLLSFFYVVESRWSCGPRISEVQRRPAADHLRNPPKSDIPSVWHSIGFSHSVSLWREHGSRNFPPFDLRLGLGGCVWQVFCFDEVICLDVFKLISIHFRAADPYLCLRIDPIPLEQTVEEWDLVSIPSFSIPSKEIRNDPSIQTKILTKVKI